LNELLGKKINENTSITRTDLEFWPWVYPTYTAKLGKKASEIDTIEIDPSGRLADVDKKNNKVEIGKLKAFENPTR
jgi:hypothetical protein